MRSRFRFPRARLPRVGLRARHPRPGRPRSISVRAVSLLLLALLAVVVFANSWGVFQTDIKPEVYLAPGEMLPRYLSAWTSSPYLGSPNFNVGLVPVLVVTALLRAVGLDPEMAFKVYHLLLWGLAAWGANRLLRTLVPTAGAWAGLVAGVAYIANPYAVAGGGTLAIALPMALLPWLLVAMTRALRDPSGWSWPAAVGLVFFGMSGMNVGVVPVYQLLLVIPLALFVRAERGLPWRDVAIAVGKCALFVVVVSLYWLIPGAAASETGGQIAESSESLDGIARTSSFVEVLRGLGLWSYYGASDAGPWLPQYAVYFTSGVIILLTMLWPAAALMSLKVVPARLARLAAAAAGIAAVIMVGLYPGGYGGSPFAALQRLLLEHIGPLVAFRTTNKIGAGLALAFALVIGWAVIHAAPRLLRRRAVAPAVGAAGAAVVVALVAPAVTGNLYVSPVDVPDYWEEAAAAVDKGDPDKRVLLLPGQTRSSYRWSLERPDDLPNSLFHRDAVIPETLPNTSAEGGNFLAALDDTLQSGTSGSNDISPFARYLGVDNVLLRHDVEWEGDGGARPGDTARALADDPGLRGLDNFGDPGTNMFTRATPPQSQEEAVLSPLQLYAVDDAPAAVRATPADGTLVVAGDAWAVPAMDRAGLLDDTPAIRYAQDLSGEELQELLRRDGRLVLTDTNQRRSAITNRLRSNQGAVLAADEDPGVSRTLGDDPRDESTLVRDGVRVTASDSGGAFFDLPHGVAENAIDGDRSTSWLFGDFRRAPGTTLTLDLPEPRTLDELSIDTTALGDVTISGFDVEVDEEHTSAEVDEDGTATVDLGGVRADEITLTVEGIRGEGFSLVGISEIDLGDDDLTATRTTRLPSTLSDLYGELPTQERSAFADTPLDVFLTRVTNTGDTADDTEQGLRRNFTLPDDRTFDTSARVRVEGQREELADELSGLDTTYRARSSYTYFDSMTHRASGAADGDDESAWVPGGRLTQSWWQLAGPERDLSEVTVTQAAGPGDEDDTAWATRATVLVDGEEVAEGELRRGTATIALPEGTSGRTVRLQIDEADDSDGERPPRFTQIDTGVRMEAGDEERPCITVATLDGSPVQMRPEDPEVINGRSGPATAWEGCGPLDVSWGEHRLRPVDDVQLDGMSFEDTQRSRHEPVPAPVVEVDRSAISSSMTIDVGESSSPYFLSIGQGHDPRWRATLEDGTDLGDPVVVDGYAAGWYIDDLDAQQITVRYGPQTRADIGLVLSGLGLLVALVVFFLPLARRRAAQVRASRESEWETPADAASADAAPADPAPASEWDDELALVEAPRRGTATATAASPVADVAPRTETSPVTGDVTGADEDEPAPPRGSLRFRGLGETLAGRSGARRLGIEGAVVVGAGALTGVGGALAALAAMLVVRLRGPRAGLLIGVGAGLLVVAALAFVAQLAWVDGTLGSVSADSVKSALVPHHIAGAGLVLAIIGTYLRPDPPEELDP